MRITDLIAKATGLSDAELVAGMPKASTLDGTKTLHDFGPLTDRLGKALIALQDSAEKELKAFWAEYDDPHSAPREKVDRIAEVRNDRRLLNALVAHTLWEWARATVPEQYRGMRGAALAFGENWHIVLIEPPRPRAAVAVMLSASDLPGAGTASLH